MEESLALSLMETQDLQQEFLRLRRISQKSQSFGRVLLLVIGVIFIVAVYEMRTNSDAVLPKVQTYSTVCDSSLGRIGSLLLRSLAERCQQVRLLVI